MYGAMYVPDTHVLENNSRVPIVYTAEVVLVDQSSNIYNNESFVAEDLLENIGFF